MAVDLALPRPSFLDCGNTIGQYGELNHSLAVKLQNTRKNLLDCFSQSEPECNCDGEIATDHEKPVDVDGDKIQTFLRIKPASAADFSEKLKECVSIKDLSTIRLYPPQDSATSKNDHRNSEKQPHEFQFTRVFAPFTTQQEFFEQTTQQTVRQFVNGEDCLLFTYGFTNSGKTFTMQGTTVDPGIIPRSLEELFQLISCEESFSPPLIKPTLYNDTTELSPSQWLEEIKFKESLMKLSDSTIVEPSCFPAQVSVESDVSSEVSIAQDMLDATDLPFSAKASLINHSVWISFAEIYNEQISDLLDPAALLGIKKSRSILKLSEDRRGKIYIKDEYETGVFHISGLRDIHVNSAEEALKLLAFGKRNLRFAATKLNESSSRRFSFCDLAGSERSSKSGSQGDRLREAGNINTSLLTLGRCIKQLRWNQRHSSADVQRIIPFRDSKLTRIFQTFLNGHGRLVMIINIGQSARLFDETFHVLKFAAVAKQVVIHKPDVPVPVICSVPLLENIGDCLQTDDEAERRTRSTIAWATEDDAEDGVVRERSTDLLEETLNADLEYVKIIEDLKQQLVDERRVRLQEEVRIREEVCHEFAERMIEMNQKYTESCDDYISVAEDLAEERANLYIRSVQKHQKHNESQSALTFNNSQDAKNEAHEEVRFVKHLQAKILALEQTIAQMSVQKHSCSTCDSNKENALVRTNSLFAQSSDGLSGASGCTMCHNRQASVVADKINCVNDENDSLVGQLASLKKECSDLQMSVKEKLETIAELSETMNEAGEAFKQKEVEVAFLQASLQAKTEELLEQAKSSDSLKRQADQEMASLQASNKTFSSEMAAFSSRISSLEQENGDLRSKLKSVTSEKILCEEGHAKLADDLKTLNEQNIATERELQRLQSAKNLLEEECLSARNQLESVTAASTKQQTFVSDLSSKLDRVEKLNTSLANELKEAQAQASLLLENKSTADAASREKVEHLTFEIRRLQTENAYCQANLVAVSKVPERRRLLETIVDLLGVQRNDDLEMMDDVLLEELLQRRIRGIMDEASTLKQAALTAQSAAGELCSERETFSNRVKELTAQVQSLENTIEQTKVAAQSRFDSLAEESSSLSAKVQTLTSDSYKLQQDLFLCKKDLHSARELNVEHKKEKLSLIETNHSLQTELASAKSALKKSEEDTERIINDHKQNENVIAELKKGLELLDGDCKKSDELIANLQAQIKSLTDDNNSLQVSLEAKSKEADELLEQLKQTEIARGFHGILPPHDSGYPQQKLSGNATTMAADLRDDTANNKTPVDPVEVAEASNNSKRRVVRKTTARKRKTQATITEETGESSDPAAAANSNCNAQETQRSCTRNKPLKPEEELQCTSTRPSRQAKSKAGEFIKAITRFAADDSDESASPYASYAKKSLEFILTGSPVQPEISTTLALAKRRKRTLYNEPTEKADFSPVEFTSAAASVDPVEFVSRKVRNQTKRTSRPARH